MKRQILFLAAAALSATATFAQNDAPAFPGAEGHGRYVTGGRGGVVKHVTNLNDSGPGSLRTAVSGSAKKIVVFDVSGVIALKSDLKIGANTTIAGQTAPYPGITLRYRTVRPDADNVIVRFIRVRRGQEKDVNDGADAIWTRENDGMIFDHCSFSWSIDEVASFYDNNNFTMQWCTAAESLNNAGHGKGAHGYGGIWGGKLASFHHNMIAHVTNRVPRFNGARYEWDGYKSNAMYDEYKWANPVQAENVDFRNCVMYNWGNSNGCYGGPGGGQINIVNNYYKGGPATPDSKAQRVTEISVASSGNSSGHPDIYGMTSRYYINGNTTETNSGTITENRDWNGVNYDSGVFTIDGEKWSLDTLNLYGDEVEHKANTDGEMCVRIKMDQPAPEGQVTTHSAATAFDKVMSYCGASLYRDDVDSRYMEEARTGTATYKGSVTNEDGLIDIVADVNGYTEDNFPSETRPEGFDTDQDGMPDEWEIANGLDPNNPDDANLYTLDTEKGWYTNVEVYINSLVEHIVKAQNADAITAVDEYYPACVPVTGIDNAPTVSSEIVKIEYFTLGGAKVSEPVKGINIRKVTYSDGKTVADKVIK
ncbi:putative uncharacterized protein [Prevotella sp. CAG:1058]|nr:putative uncharacterized protein [Prevotella sp. CAG:1058]